MIIDKAQLIELLVEKTGLAQDQVEGQLSQLIERIQEAAEEGKAFEIENFGTFGMEDGVLQFTPADRLETEINNKYAGMKPIELIGAFKEPEEGEIPDISEMAPEQSEKAWSFDKDNAEEEKQQKETVREPEETEIEEVPEQKPAMEEAQEEFEELVNAGEKESQKSSQGSEKKTEEKIVEEKKEKDPIGRLLVAAVVILVVGIGSVLMYDMGIFQELGRNNTRSHSEISDNTLPAEKTKVEQPVISSEPENKDLVSNDEAAGEAPQDTQQGYGLKGNFNPSVDNGYMIVVHSLQNKQQAEANKQQLVEKGYRTSINEANVKGTLYYRVGIGQFESIENARKAIERIPEPYRSNNFIKRIQ
ncbi:SPOR domain-containing protein [Fodinibius saliphilus]|uniref:SPOR domain-containing protein n=1 Tax=Fodinibius saliphilus TaxID=1920650 RepID=UPI0011097492|nr:SPOR domain-containing protein [Fodinibius saliphilus]